VTTNATLPATPSSAAFRRSQTFLARLPDPAVYKLRFITVGSILLLFFVFIPLLNLAGVIPNNKVNVLGKYLSLAVVALGIDLIWGYTGILSLCQAFFFCLGGYAIGMHLSLPEGGGLYKVPQFMEFAYYGHHGQLPPFWQPFHSLFLSIIAGIVVPMLAAGIFGFFIFRSRVRGVYFSIVTQAVAFGTSLLFLRNEMLLGGNNGLTNFYHPLTQARSWILGLYLTTLVVIALTYLLCRALTRSRLGRVLIAVRDKETRLYFAGYRPYAFKVFAFAVAGGLAGIGGMLYAPQAGLITPQNMSVEASIMMVIWVALGGRGRLWGSIFGTLLVNATFSSLTSDIALDWLLVQGLMFIFVVLGFPDGVVGVWEQMEKYVKLRDWRQFFTTGGLLLTVVLFVLAESLNLMPRFLNITLMNVSGTSLKLKYFVLMGLLGGGYWRSLLVRTRVATGRGFPVVVKGVS
jgi:urea transport system permease protein